MAEEVSGSGHQIRMQGFFLDPTPDPVLKKIEIWSRNFLRGWNRSRLISGLSRILLRGRIRIQNPVEDIHQLQIAAFVVSTAAAAPPRDNR